MFEIDEISSPVYTFCLKCLMSSMSKNNGFEKKYKREQIYVNFNY